MTFSVVISDAKALERLRQAVYRVNQKRVELQGEVFEPNHGMLVEVSKISGQKEVTVTMRKSDQPFVFDDEYEWLTNEDLSLLGAKLVTK